MVRLPSPQALAFVALAAALGLGGCGRASATSPAFKPGGGIANGTSQGGQSLAPLNGGVRLLTGQAGSATGTVTGPDGRPLAGVKVVAQPGGQQAITGANGSFRIEGLAEGNHTFQATLAGMSQAMPAGLLVVGNQVNEVPAIMLSAGGPGGSLGITALSYRHELTFGDRGQAPALLVSPLAVALKQGNTVVLDRNPSALVHTGVLRQYKADGSFEGKYGDYTKWLGLKQLKDDVRAFAIDAQGQSWVIDGANQLWRFSADGNKEAAADLGVEGANDLAIHPSTGHMVVASASGLTKLNAVGQAPTPLSAEGQGEVKAVAFAKGGGYWTIQGNQVVQVSEQGAAGATIPGLTQPVDLAVDPTNGVVLVADAGTKNVLAYDPTGALIGKVGDGMFDAPAALAVDATGKVTVLDAVKKKLYRFFPAGAR